MITLRSRLVELSEPTRIVSQHCRKIWGGPHQMRRLYSTYETAQNELNGTADVHGSIIALCLDRGHATSAGRDRDLCESDVR